MDKLVNARQAAKILGVCTQTIYQKFEQGDLPGFRLGRSVRFDMEELKNSLRHPASASTENEIQNSTGTKSE